MDVRDRAHAVPRWIKDPLSGHRERKIEARLPNPFGIDLLPLKAITKRGKGSVYKALDLSVLPARFVIVKEGLRHGETNWLGLDGFAQIKHEGTILRHLRKAGVPVPAVFREFTRDKNRYLVLEMIRGRPLLSRGGLQPQKKSWKQVELLLRRISAALATIHRAGYVWRDCKPEHIFCWRGDIRFVDFEGACRIDEVDAPPWATSAYSPPSCHRALTRQRGTLEDDYALGVIAFQFGTGKLPPASARSRITLYKRTKCPSALRAKIEQWLTPKISRRLVK
jgi:serine/threonine protein kinase